MNMDRFLWGAATSAHQVEGNQENNWSRWEKTHAPEWMRRAVRMYRNLPHWDRIKTEVQDSENYISGTAADHYHRYREDFELLKSFGLNSYRFSIEWSRIEPRKGVFNADALRHYRDVLETLHELRITPFVTLHHFTEPVWLEETGGWTSKAFPALFDRYVAYVVEGLTDLVQLWMTFNEPESYLLSRYLNSPLWPGWPYQEQNYRKYLRANHGFVEAHKQAYKTIKRINPNGKVGYGHGIVCFEPGNRWSRPVVSWLEHTGGTGKFKKTIGYQDYLGLQYYLRNTVSIKPRSFRQWAEMIDSNNTSDIGWEPYPAGLYQITQRLKRYKLPIYVTENGIADSRDEQRGEFIRSHAAAMMRSIRDGADIRGYFYWSLLDNYEWSSGFWPRFGLVAVDYSTLERWPRPSAKVYREIAQNYSFPNS